ncbi:MAG: type II toxin-antitoxin system VapB family antitoxin [Dehalococcoidia bacterium]|nr:type II toxin-antitoxin system VapB family antitoxin [Dehalococcoidia bacterium]
MMCTTVDIDEELLQSVVEATGQTSKSKAVTKALEEYVRRARIEDRGLVVPPG